MTSARPALRALAERAGVLSSYVDLGGVERDTPDETREALLAAMGLPAGSEEEAAARIAELERAERERPLEPVRVVREGREASRVLLRLPAVGAARWRLQLHEEGVDRPRLLEGRARARAPGAVRRLDLGATPGPGYHRVRVDVSTPHGERSAEQLLVVAPPRCPDPLARTGGRRAWGVVANLYSVRSERNWGAGDVGDLVELAGWSAAEGAAFVGVNPLHALRNAGAEVSPYGPISRLYRNVLYLDVERVPELGGSVEARELLAEPQRRAAIAALRAGDRVRYAEALALKRPVLEALHRAFAAGHRGRDDERGRAYAEWLEREGSPLDDFATFLAIEERLASDGVPPGAWRSWPAGLRHPRNPDVAAFREANAEVVDLHRWMQFELDRQLGEAAARGREAGLAIGIYQDLAIGTSGGGSDPWAFPGLFVEGASIGAPPDDFSARGQDWGLPPLNPHVLRAEAHRYWICLLRSAFAHAGALRIDHVMGLWRQYWIPAGRSGAEGAYVRYPADELAGILALESHRHAAPVVGEDLGTVPAGLREELDRRGILSSRVLPFERDGSGGFLPASRYGRRALVTANTHDLPPLAGWWNGRDLELRREAGHLADDEALERARAERRHDRAALLRRLRAAKVVDAAAGADDDAPVGYAELTGAVHGFLGRTPSALAGAALDDLGGETAPVNLPGVPLDRYPSWSRRMRLTLAQIAASAPTRRALDALRAERGRATG